MSEDTLLPFDLPSVVRKKVSVAFDGGLLSSNAGVLLLRGVEKELGLAARLASCIREWRKPEAIVHPLEEMLRLRMFAIAAGYEDGNDCDSLRHDPIFKMAVGHAPESGDPLCSQPTMSRLENAPSKIEIARLMAAMVDQFCDSYRRAPSSITLDIDDTFDAVHGHQQLSLFNAHYDERCFLPIHIYEATSGKPVAMILREGKTPSGKEVRTVLKHVIRRIRRHWPRVHILVRGDSHYGRDEVMEWCDAQGRRQASLRDALLRAGQCRELHQAAQEPARLRPHLMPRAQSQPVPPDRSHRRLLADARHALRRTPSLAAVVCRVRYDAPSSDQDRRARGGGCGPHPCLPAYSLSRSRCLPCARRTALRCRTIATAAPSPHRTLRRNIQPRKIKQLPPCRHRSTRSTCHAARAKSRRGSREQAILGE